MIRLSQVKLPIDHSREDLKKKAARALRISPEAIQELAIVKQSIDARKREEITYSYVLDIKTAQEERVVKRAKNPNAAVKRTPSYCFPSPGSQRLLTPPVIIGTGPAGLFCGLMLARAGYCPILLERGGPVEDRMKKVEDFWQGKPLDPQCNVQFGEGGAGTFSDGKLNTLVKDPSGRNGEVLKILTQFGVDPSICYVNKPHVGTDVLSRVVRGIRQEIIRLGGQVRFYSQATDFIMADQEKGRQSLKGLIINGTERLDTQAVVLAVGHSARDTFEMLRKHSVPMQAKSFAVGVRMEHPQEMINLSRYGKNYPSWLPAAAYKVTRRAGCGRGVYSFCMCPGGYVVNASSESGRLAVNGMSYQARDGRNANSAMIVTVTPEDFGGKDALAGMEFQRRLEAAAYRLGKGKVPVQLFGDFCRNTATAALGEVEPCIKGGYELSNVREIFPEELSAALEEGIKGCDSLIHGFARRDAVLSGVESRTSSPVRIVRNEAFESGIRGLYPCGEGAGYAGGITSAAMDGLKIAEAIAKKYAPCYD